MILCCRERDRTLAVAQREERCFLPFEELFHDDLRVRSTELPRKYSVDCRFRLGDTSRDHDALAGGKSVCLHHDGRALGAHIGLCRQRRIEALIAGGRNGIGPAQVLGETLGAFELRGGLARPERPDARRREVVHNARAQRRLGPDHDKTDAVCPAESDHTCVVPEIKRNELAFLRDPGIAGRTIEALHQGARRDLPGEGMLAAAGPQDKDVHLNSTRDDLNAHVTWRSGFSSKQPSFLWIIPRDTPPIAVFLGKVDRC